MLAELVYARRPSVTTALKRLSPARVADPAQRRADDLHGAPPSGSARGLMPPAERFIREAVAT